MLLASHDNNVIYWNKTSGQGIQYFKIYKETTQSGVYDTIEMFQFDNENYFDDLNSDPNVESARYKISAVDICGNEGPLSPLHKTMHLTINKGLGGAYNLIWDDYEGFNFNTYFIMRTVGSNPWVKIDSIQSNLYSYTDLNPPTGTNALSF